MTQTTGTHLLYTDMLLEWVEFISFQTYDWVASFPFQYIKGVKL